MAANRTRTVGVVLAWLLAAGVATLVGALAVGAIGSGIVPSGQQPLSQAEVDRRLAEPAPSQPAGSTPPTSSQKPSTSSKAPTRPADKPQTRTFSSSGGTVTAKCDPGVIIAQAVPAQGFEVDVEAEDGGQRVRFEQDEGERIELQVNCRDGKPVSSTRSGNSGHGGGDDDD